MSVISAKAFTPSPPRAVDIVPRATGSGAGLARLQQLFRDSGGLATGEAVTAMLRERCDQPISVVARWIVDRRVVSVEAGGHRWLPLFQFDPVTLEVRRGVGQAIDELGDVFDDSEIAEWFAMPNTWLGNVSPAVAVAFDPAAVLEAARADRFVAAG